MYMGIYNGKKKHESDIDSILSRAWDAGLQKMMITGTTLSDSKKSIEMAKTNGLIFIFFLIKIKS